MPATAAAIIHEANFIAKNGVQILINTCGTFVWINIDGICALRVAVPKNAVAIEDDRVLFKHSFPLARVKKAKEPESAGKKGAAKRKLIVG